MEYIAIILAVLLISGGALGALWRWRFLPLVVTAIILALGVFIGLRGWSDLDFSAVIRSGSAMISWVVHLLIEAAWAVLPVLLGALAGWHLCRRFCVRANAS